jgi:DNA-binding transcriptional LysR family regulator
MAAPLESRAPRPTAIEIRHLKALLALSRDPHFGRAALRLHVAQSTLSRTLADLEALVGVQLVHRSQRTTGLTDAGRAMLSGAEAAVRAAELGVAAARSAGARAPVLGVEAPTGHRWARELERTIRGQVDVRQLALGSGFACLRGEVDAMVSLLPMVPPDDLRFLALDSVLAHAALPSRHSAARRRRVALRALADEPLLMLPWDEVWWRDFDLICRAQGIDMTLGGAARSMHEALAMVAAGEGWMLAAGAEAFHPWDGVALRPARGVAPIRVALVWRDERADRAAPLIDAMQHVLREAHQRGLSAP